MRAFLLALCLCSVAVASRAQDDPRHAASDHFRRGIQLYDEGHYDSALAELQRAYDILPTPEVLYNLGRAQARLGDSVAAARNYEGYLADPATHLSRRERRAITAELEEQRARIAHIQVETNVPGAIVTLGDVDVGPTPLPSPLAVTAGDVTVGAHAPGYDTARQQITIAGGVDRVVTLELHRIVEPRGTLRIACTLPGVAVNIDGNAVGTTPMADTLSLPPGAHVVVGRRAGYHDARASVDVREGAETTATLAPEMDLDAPAAAIGRVRLPLPHAPAHVRVDGRDVTVTDGEVELPVGPHDARIEVAERSPLHLRIDVTAEHATTVHLDLDWTPAAHAARLASAASQRTLGWVTLISGAVLAVAAGAVAIFGETNYASGGARRTRIAHCASLGFTSLAFNRECTSSPPAPNDYDPLVAAEGRLADDTNLLRAAYISGGVLGLAAITVGAVLLTSAPSDAQIDRDAGEGVRVRFVAGLGSAGLAGTF